MLGMFPESDKKADTSKSPLSSDTTKKDESSKTETSPFKFGSTAAPVSLSKYLTVKHEFHETCHSVTFYFIKKTPNDAVTPQRQSQFTPKMKANAEPRLLSSLV